MVKKGFIILFVFILAGCTTYHGLQPIQPSKVDETISTRPMFQWRQSDKTNVTYDFIIYELIWRKTVPVPGETVYYRENLEKAEHTIETDLTPGKEYLWAIRVREGENLGPWSLYDFSAFYGLGYIIQRRHLFQLKIIDPKAPKLKSLP
jgi:hypothetical protein